METPKLGDGPSTVETSTMSGSRRTPRGRGAEGWDPAWLFPPNGATTTGMVFTTQHGNEHTIWTLTRFDPSAGEVEYVRTTPGARVGVVLVRCTAAGPAETRVEVSYAITALTEQGNAAIGALDAARFSAYIDSWREAIARL